MNPLYYALVTVLTIILLYILLSQEALNEPKAGSGSYIRLYEGFNQHKLRIDVEQSLNEQFFFRGIEAINLKSIDIWIPKKNNVLDQYRRVELWNVYPGDTTASTESTFYSMDEPYFALRANPGKYQFITRVLPGEHVKTDILTPVKKIFLLIYV